MILPDKGSPEGNAWAREGSNRFAAQLGHSVRVELPNGAAGSGVFMGYDPDGAFGHVLTAAHLFNKPEADKRATPGAIGTTLRFCAPGAFGNPDPDIRFLARQAFLHPDYRGPIDEAPKEGELATAGADLALLTFAVSEGDRRDLKALGYTSASLYDGPATQDRTLLEAHVAGFGCYATSTSAVLEDSGTLLGGSTYVSHRSFRGRNAFHAVSLAPDKREDKGFEPVEGKRRNHRQFLQGPETKAWRVEEEPIPVKPHPRQVHLCFGDSGGPLFLVNGGQPQLAGIARSGTVDCALTNEGAITEIQVSTWQPMVEHGQWLHAVMAGDPGGSRVLDLLEAKQTDDAPVAAEPPEEHKTPAEAHRHGEKRKAAGPPEEDPRLSADGAGGCEPAAKRRKLENGAVAAPRLPAVLDLPGPQTIRNASGSTWRILFPQLPWTVRVERLEEGKEAALLAELQPGPKRWADIPGRSRVRITHAADPSGKSLLFALAQPGLFRGEAEGSGPLRWIFQAEGKRDLEWFLGSARGWKLGAGVVYQGEELELQGMFHDESFGG